MLQKIGYISLHYSFLFAFILASWGIGYWALRRMSGEVCGLLEHGLVTTLGIGLFICCLQWMGIAGVLHIEWIMVLICFGILIGIVQIVQLNFRECLQDFCAVWKSRTLNERAGLLIVILLAASTFLDPLGPPTKWDELMYHLPHAKQWANTGQLGVNEWLRYPWFPYNYDLLYAAALIVSNDVVPHLIHACAGWLVALIIYQFCARYLNHGVACLSSIIWLMLARPDFSNAYIDMGITLFLISSCVAFYLFVENAPSKYIWLMTSAFLLGVAVGAKYQALSFLPPLMIALIVKERRPRILLLVIAVFLIPCIYWYARNWVLTGDPINPIGGPIFGFSDWNIGDHRMQFQDLQRNAGWPSSILLPALLTPLIATCWKSLSIRYAIIFCSYCMVVWVASSHYPRYLMPLFPLLALLAAVGWLLLWNFVAQIVGKLNVSLHPHYLKWAWVFVLLVLCFKFLSDFASEWRRLPSTDIVRNKVLEEKVSGYKVMKYIQNHAVGKLYQFGLEDAIYYAPAPIWGDHFGPGRYRDFSALDSAQLSRKLREKEFESLLVHTERWPQIAKKQGFNDHFSKIYEADGVELYRILDK